MRILKQKNKQGSLTVEACLAFPVFLIFFFFLLTLSKIAWLNIVLDQAAKETVQQLAAVSYPLRFLNEQLDLEMMEVEADFAHSDEFWLNLFSGKIKGADFVDLGQRLQPDSGYNPVENALLKTWEQPGLYLKNKGKYFLAREILGKRLSGQNVDLNKLKLAAVELPQSEKEFADNKLRQRFNFGPDDVLLYLTYQVDLPLPMGKLKEIELSCLAVERAWLYGSNGIYAGEEAEKLPPANQEEEFVYLCRSPTEVYHPYRDCKYIVDKIGVRKVTLREAKERGLRVHAGCPELFK